jgi:hypothetical protein
MGLEAGKSLIPIPDLSLILWVRHEQASLDITWD